jgi:hypothetical protein
VISHWALVELGETYGDRPFITWQGVYLSVTKMTMRKMLSDTESAASIINADTLQFGCESVKELPA